MESQTFRPSCSGGQSSGAKRDRSGDVCKQAVLSLWSSDLTPMTLTQPERKFELSVGEDPTSGCYLNILGRIARAHVNLSRLTTAS